MKTLEFRGHHSGTLVLMPNDRHTAPFSAGQVADFQRDGFLGPVPILTMEEVLALRERVDYLCQNLDSLEPELYEVEAAHTARPEDVVCHFLGGWRVDERLRELVFDPRLTRAAAQLLGVDRLRFWHDQVFYKPAGHPGVVPWHQDYSYWTRTAPARHVTINILLDNADEESGCLQFVPGSQEWGLLPSVGFDQPLEKIRESLLAGQEFVPRAVPVAAGSATIHHSHTLHGSGPNRSSRPRRALAFNYMCAQTRVADDSAPLLRGAPHLSKGELVAGELFPVVWKAAISRHGS